jgi:hypothetical protein
MARALAAAQDMGERLVAAKRRVTAAQEQLLDAKNARAAVDAQFKRGGQIRSRGLDEARKAHRAAASDLADKALADVGRFGADQAETRKQLDALREARDARAGDVRTCELAMKAYDEGAFKKGLTLVGAMAAVFVVLLGVGFYFVALSGGAPPPPAATVTTDEPPAASPAAP